MRQRGYCYPYSPSTGVPRIVESGPLGTTVRVHDRPNYTKDQAREVCAWVNGIERPLETMVDRVYDPFDPERRQMRRGLPLQRKGMMPLVNRD